MVCVVGHGNAAVQCCHLPFLHADRGCCSAWQAQLLQHVRASRQKFITQGPISSPSAYWKFFLDADQINDLCDAAEHIFRNEPSVLRLHGEHLLSHTCFRAGPDVLDGTTRAAAVPCMVGDKTCLLVGC